MNEQERDRLSAAGELEEWQRELLRGITRVAAIVGLVVVGVAIADSYTAGQLWTIPFYIAAYLGLAIFLVIPNPPVGLHVAFLLVSVYILGIVDFVQDGPTGSGRAFMLAVPVVASAFYRRRTCVLILAGCAATMAGMGLAFSAHVFSIPAEPAAAELSQWLVGTATLVLLGAVMIAPLDFLLPRLVAALQHSRALTSELEKQRAGLETEVNERTADLARRSEQLATAADVARQATSIQDVEELLQEAVQLVSQRFGFYHTGIFLTDRTGQFEVLRAASSDGGQRMITRRHQLRIGQEGIVGQVAAQGKAHVALDVGADAVFFDNPDLPQTRSELALPMRSRGEIIGVLDVQSREPEAFGGDDIAVLQTLADQVAVAVGNARLFEELQRSLESERRAVGEIGQRAWESLSRQRPDLDRRYDPQGLLPTTGGWRDEMRSAITTGEPALGDNPALPSVAVPLKIRGQVVGVIEAHRARPDTGPANGDPRAGWEKEEVELLEALADQLGAALDSARLYQDTQRRAAREQLAAQVTARIRETLDLDTVLRTATEEMREALGLSAMTIRLAPAGEEEKE